MFKMPNLTKFQKYIHEAKISKAMVADYVRDRKKSKSTFVEHVSKDPVVTENEPEKTSL